MMPITDALNGEEILGVNAKSNGTPYRNSDDGDNANSTSPLLSRRDATIESTKTKLAGRYSRNYDESTNTGEGSVYHDFTKSNEPEYDCDGYLSEGYDVNYLESHKKFSPLHQIIHKIQFHLQKWFPCLKKFLPLRILLLALYLAFTLSSFWILDSIKEPTLAILVKGDLGMHQPRAKMISFVVVVALAVGMEWADRLKRGRKMKRQQRAQRLDEVCDHNGKQIVHERRNSDIPLEELEANAALEKSWNERNLPSSMMNSSSRLRRMGVRIGQHFHRGNVSTNDSDDDQKSASKITTLAFYVVGSLYIHGFVTVAIALRQHPAFHSDGAMHEGSEDNFAGGSGNSEWYYPALGYTLFALIESFGSVSITIFWAFANSHLTLEAAERHYGSIVAVAQAGAISGSTLSAVLGSRRGNSNVLSDEELLANDSLEVEVSIIERSEQNDAEVTPMLIFLACGCIGAGMAVIALYSKLFSKPMRQHGEVVHQSKQQTSLCSDGKGIGGNPVDSLVRYGHYDEDGNSDNVFRDLFGGIHLILKHDYLKLVLAVSVLYEIALTCMHYELNLIGLDRFGVGISITDESEIDGFSSAKESEQPREEITYIQFMGWYGQTVNILSLFLSFYAFPRLIKHYGLRITIRIFPTFLLFVTIFVFVLLPRNLYFLFIALSLCKALTYSVHDPAEEVLYMPTSDSIKFRAKFWIDVVGQRVAKAVGSAINNYAGSVEGIVMYGSLPSVVASIALWLACYQVGILFDGLIQSGDVVGFETEQLVLGIEMTSLEDDAKEDDPIKNNNESDDNDESPLFRDPEEEIFHPAIAEVDRVSL
ncbi:hypothetical protein ACHAXS_001752 [Conticribra weissflogii]